MTDTAAMESIITRPKRLAQRVSGPVACQAQPPVVGPQVAHDSAGPGGGFLLDNKEHMFYHEHTIPIPL
jgi:hypothetical protein